MTGSLGVIWDDTDGRHIDVRGLAPPEPMVAILELLEHPDTGGHVIIHLDRDPIFLYPELAERGWAHEIYPAGDDEFALLLTRS